MWHSNHRECSEPVGQQCCVTSAKPRIIFHTPIFWHVTPCQLTYSYERIRGPSRLHLHAPSRPRKVAFLHPEQTGSSAHRNMTTRSTSVIATSLATDRSLQRFFFSFPDRFRVPYQSQYLGHAGLPHIRSICRSITRNLPRLPCL